LYYIPVFLIPLIIKIGDMSIPLDDPTVANSKNIIAYIIFVADSAVLKTELFKYNKTPWKIKIGWMVYFAGENLID
jgi:hypothetical protein